MGGKWENGVSLGKWGQPESLSEIDFANEESTTYKPFLGTNVS
jgi:hypothetical protein